MARLHSSGFEQGTAGDSVEWSFVNNAPTVVTSPTRYGTYAGAITSLTSGVDKFFQNNFAAANIPGGLFARFYLYITTLPNVNTTIFTFEAAAGGQTVSLDLLTDGRLSLSYNAAVTNVGSSSALSLNRWYRVEVKQDVTNNIAELRLDGVVVVTTSTATGQTGSNAYRLGGNLFVQTCTVINIAFDDAAVNDTSGTSQTGYPGEGAILHLKPRAAGDNNTWEKSAGTAGDANNFNQVSENTPDDGTTYLKRVTTTIKTDDYLVTNPASVGIYGTDVITLVAVGVRGGSTTAVASTATDILLRLKSASAGTVLKSASTDNRLNTASGNYVTHTSVDPKNHKLIAYTDPTTGVAWTITGTNSLTNIQIGMENSISSTTETRVTTIWAMVEVVRGNGWFKPVNQPMQQWTKPIIEMY